MLEADKKKLRLFAQMCDIVDLYTADIDTEYDFGLTLYSWEPFAKQQKALQRVVEWYTTNVPRGCAWRVNVFCIDGYLKCSNRGEEIDEDDEPIAGTSVFS